MNWSNLKSNLCPKCSKSIAFCEPNARGRIACNCGFSIHKSRMAEIVSDMVSQDLNRQQEAEEIDNLTALNNL